MILPIAPNVFVTLSLLYWAISVTIAWIFDVVLSNKPEIPLVMNTDNTDGYNDSIKNSKQKANNESNNMIFLPYESLKLPNNGELKNSKKYFINDATPYNNDALAPALTLLLVDKISILSSLYINVVFVNNVVLVNDDDDVDIVLASLEYWSSLAFNNNDGNAGTTKVNEIAYKKYTTNTTNTFFFVMMINY